jgi:dTDP-glucose 4,6-dehydratase
MDVSNDHFAGSATHLVGATSSTMGTFRLLDVCLRHWQHLPEPERAAFPFLHISTDEVYGTLAPTDAPFAETNAYQPK